MKKKVIDILKNTLIALIIPLTGNCQGVNNNGIDPVLMEHVKSVIDFYPDCGKTLKVYQFDNRKFYIYGIWPKQGSFWFDTGRNTDKLRFILPTNAIKYKDKYILFYLHGKKILSDKSICKILGISSKDDIPNYQEVDSRIWIYVKEKKSNKSAFVQIEYGTNTYEYPKLRYLNEGEQDSIIIDMVIQSLDIHGKKRKSNRFSSPDKILISMSIFNKSDSAILIGLNPDLYGSFIIKNGEHSIPLIANVKINNNYSDFHECSPGLYSIIPHGEMNFNLKTAQQSIILKDTSPKEYAHKLYDLFYDSIYYIPTKSIQVPNTINKSIWNKKFKVYYPITNWYNFWVNDSIYNIYPDGESTKYAVDKYRYYWFKE